MYVNFIITICKYYNHYVNIFIICVNIITIYVNFFRKDHFFIHIIFIIFLFHWFPSFWTKLSFSLLKKILKHYLIRNIHYDKYLFHFYLVLRFLLLHFLYYIVFKFIIIFLVYIFNFIFKLINFANILFIPIYFNNYYNLILLNIQIYFYFLARYLKLIIFIKRF